MIDTRPTYRIPAREVVPGMLYVMLHKQQAVPITDIERHGEELIVWRGQSGRGLHRHEIMDVQLPGPSPRELACTCWEDGLQHDYEYRWEDEAIRQHGAACSEYAQRRAELACARPSEHSPDCPVATVPGKHGAMRLWPAPWRDLPWGWRSGWQCISPTWQIIVFPTDVARRALADERILQCFYLPPVPQPERREPPAWDPYGTDLDLAVRYG